MVQSQECVVRKLMWDLSWAELGYKILAVVTKNSVRSEKHRGSDYS
jgi:hypothetical protein